MTNEEKLKATFPKTIFIFRKNGNDETAAIMCSDEWLQGDYDQMYKGSEPCEDAISRKSIKQKLQEHHDFFVNAYGGFSNLPQNDKSRVDEITNCIAMVVNEPPVTPKPRWIPVSERLPEKTGLYLVSIGDLVTTGSFDGHNFRTQTMVRFVPDAWMPLPEPYKEGETNENRK